MEGDSSHFLVVQHEYLKKQQHNFHTNTITLKLRGPETICKKVSLIRKYQSYTAVQPTAQ